MKKCTQLIALHGIKKGSEKNFTAIMSFTEGKDVMAGSACFANGLFEFCIWGGFLKSFFVFD